MTDIYEPERRLKAALKDAWEGDVVTLVCQYLREALDQVSDEFPEARMAKKLVDLIEGQVS